MNNNGWRLVSDTRLSEALDFLRDNAEAIGKAKAETIRCGHMIKHIEALVEKAHDDLALAAQKREARASKRYVEALNADAKAAGDYEAMKAKREAAAMAIEAWRSEQANYRSMKI